MSPKWYVVISTTKYQELLVDAENPKQAINEAVNGKGQVIDEWNDDDWKPFEPSLADEEAESESKIHDKYEVE